ncbi:hypothetical protein IFR04_009100, partial [Cadophora malorum]
MASPQPVAPDVPPPNSKSSSPITTSPMSETVPTLLTMPSSAETNIPSPVVASSYQAIEHLDPSLSEKLPVLADKSTPSKPSSTSPSSKLKISTPRFGNLHKDRDQANDNQGSSSHLAEALVDMPENQLKKVAATVSGAEMYASVDELPGRTRPETSLPTANQWLSSTEGIGGISHIATSAPPKSGQPDYAEASESVNTSTLSLTEARPDDGNKRDKTKRKTQPKPKPKATPRPQDQKIFVPVPIAGREPAPMKKPHATARRSIAKGLKKATESGSGVKGKAYKRVGTVKVLNDIEDDDEDGGGDDIRAYAPIHVPSKPTLARSKNIDRIMRSRGQSKGLPSKDQDPFTEQEEDDGEGSENEDERGLRYRGGMGSPDRDPEGSNDYNDSSDSGSDSSSDSDTDSGIDPTVSTSTLFSTSTYLHADSAAFIAELSTRMSVLKKKDKKLLKQNKELGKERDMLRDQLEKALEDAKALRVGIKRKHVEVMAAEERVREVEGEIRG